MERSEDGLPIRVERDNECQLCRLLDYRGDGINEPEGTVVIPRDDGGLKTIHCCERCADELWGDDSGWTPYDDGELVTDGGKRLGNDTAQCPECNGEVSEKDPLLGLWMCDDCEVGFNDNGQVIAR
jgi:hypothetical protein